MDIKEALASLDALDDEQWTQDGAPKTDVVSELVGHKVSRAEIIEAAPKFSRENMVLEDDDKKEPEVETETEETVIDNSVLEAFAEMDPMLPEELAANVLSKIDPMQLESVEKLLIEQIAVSDAKQKEIDEMNRRLKVSRAEIIEAAPKFSRENMVLEDEKEQEVETETETEETVIDNSVLEAFAEMDPMLPEELAAKVLSKIDPMQLESVEKLLIEQIAVSAAKQKDIDEMNRRLKLSLATTRLWIKQLVPDMNNQQAIQEYIKQSQANRAAKNSAIQQILGGAKLSDLVKLDPRAAIDRAFARKTARGGNRPTR